MKTEVKVTLPHVDYPDNTRDLEPGDLAYISYNDRRVLIKRQWDYLIAIDDNNAVWSHIPQFPCAKLPKGSVVTLTVV